MRAPVAVVLGIAVVASGCLPASATPWSVADRVATGVSATLTAELPLPTIAPAATETPPPSATTAVTLVPPTPTTPPTMTPSPTGSPTPVTGDPRASLGSPTWRDPLDSGTGWNLGADSFTEAEVEDGVLRLIGKSTADGWRLTWPEVEDAYLEASIQTKTCTGSDEYGLMLRVPDIHDADGGYLYGFTCDGRYFLRAWDGDEMTTLVAATAAASIHSGSDKTNRIGVMLRDEKLSLYANGTLLTEIEDDAFPAKGGFGVFIGARRTENFTIEMTEIAYWNLP